MVQHSRKLQTRKKKSQQPAKPITIVHVRVEDRAPSKVFYLNITISFGPRAKTTYTLPAGAAQADQGSNSNIIDQGLVDRFRIPLINIRKIRHSHLVMVAIDHCKTVITHFIQLIVTCEGISHEI